MSTFIPNNITSLEKLHNEESTDTNDVLDDKADKDMDNNAVNGLTVLAHVELARSVCKYITSSARLCLKVFVADCQLSIADLATEINQPDLIEHVRRFLYDQLYSDSNLPSSNISLNACPTFLGKVSIFLSHTMLQATHVELEACIMNIFELPPPGGWVLHVMTVFL